MRGWSLRFAAAGCALAWLSSCAIGPRETQVATRDASELQEWRARGRIAVAGPDGGGSGSFTWWQRGENAEINLRGPIGIGSVQLALSANSIRVRTGDGQEFEAEPAQEELAARLGAHVPARDLRYWMVGLAAPGEHRWTTSADTATLTQQDWRIEYRRFGVADGVRLPLRLEAVNGPAKVRVVIDRWQVETK